MIKRLWKLFISTLYISAFTFGGGYVIVSLLKKKFVDELTWINEEEMLDLVSIAQSSPGAIAVNGAIVVGYKIAGIIGVIVSIIGTIIPPMLIIILVSYFYEIFKDNLIVRYMLEGMSIGVGALVISVALEMLEKIIKDRNVLLFIIFLVAFGLNLFFNVSVAYIVLACIVLGLIRNYCLKEPEL